MYRCIVVSVNYKLLFKQEYNWNMSEREKGKDVAKTIEGGGVLVGLIGLLGSIPAVALSGILVVSSVELYKYMKKSKK